MARPRSDDKRNAIIAAAVRVIAKEGLAAPTALIAKKAGVSNGTLFIYFETKVDLHNQLYVELKTELATATMQGVRQSDDLREQLYTMWMNNIDFSTKSAEKRRVLSLLGVGDDLTPESRNAGNSIMAPVAALLDRARRHGPLKDAPLPYVAALMNAVGETTIDFILKDPASRKRRSEEAFQALWRIIT